MAVSHVAISFQICRYRYLRRSPVNLSHYSELHTINNSMNLLTLPLDIINEILPQTDTIGLTNFFKTCRRGRHLESNYLYQRHTKCVFGLPINRKSEFVKLYQKYIPIVSSQKLSVGSLISLSKNNHHRYGFYIILECHGNARYSIVPCRSRSDTNCLTDRVFADIDIMHLIAGNKVKHHLEYTDSLRNETFIIRNYHIIDIYPLVIGEYIYIGAEYDMTALYKYYNELPTISVEGMDIVLSAKAIVTEINRVDGNISSIQINLVTLEDNLLIEDATFFIDYGYDNILDKYDYEVAAICGMVDCVNIFQIRPNGARYSLLVDDFMILNYKKEIIFI